MPKTEKETPRARWMPEEAREHMRTARAEMRASYEALFPPKFVEHRRAARKEALLAIRSMVDKAIEHLEA